ncbi:CPBP family intramembrane glutamic endopeptidase [Chryseobacterium schmidteae]|uniref:CPBP family intramembrane glutamic endopeptidase n=1 Tax=Chryseobacterium schmidteae TaxID=2730404 RepID=UPI00158D2412|nr:CPBP family intramembrane glutamic endopeptidase [Chryseobacterium schmidteae]
MFLFFSALSIVLDYFDFEDTSSRAVRFNDINIVKLLIAGVIIAPILEEIAFRGMFTSKKYLKFISYGGMALFIIFQENYFLIPFLMMLIFLFEYKDRKHFLQISYFVNAFLFSMMHYQFSDLLSISSFPGILGTLGLALVFIWLVINFGIWASILLHFITNFSLIMIAIIGYESLDQKTRKVENNNFEMTIQRVSLFEQKETVIFQDGSIDAKNTSIRAINQSLCPDSELKDIYFGKFNIHVKRKANIQQKLDCTIFKQLLDKSNINEE